MRKNRNKSHRDKSFDSQCGVLNFIFRGFLDMPLGFYDKNRIGLLPWTCIKVSHYLVLNIRGGPKHYGLQDLPASHQI